MLKETTYKQKIPLLDKWFPIIIDTVKKEIKNEHLKNDRVFYVKYCGSKNVNKLSLEELVTAYRRAIDEEEQQVAESIGEFLTNRWILKNSDVYDFFEKKLSTLVEDFNQLVELDKEFSDSLKKEAVEKFGPVKTYLFSVMNSVVFPKETFEELREMSEKETIRQEEETLIREEGRTTEELHEKYRLQINRLQDKYEKKLAGLEKKYHKDMEMMKKQMIQLQRKLEKH